ncbi:MAG: aspartate aminotransferase family protein [Proteobacteria bacterium]|nr:aspartate aminotransferase family protein [Pseudomonadota bacterium]
MSLISAYSPLPVSFERGEGIWLWDGKNKEPYLDALTGIAVCGLGHAHPEITKAICDQASKLIHTSNVYQIELQTELAAKLTALSGMEQAFFSNSGAEANEAAIKLARAYGHQREINHPHIVVLEGAFHGRTLATLTATANRKGQAGYEPLVSGFIRAPFNDSESIKNMAHHNNEIVAVMLEPIQGEGGIHLPPSDYLKKIRELCDQNNWLMILDEVQTGNGRTGSYFNYQQHGILPDIVTTAKGLGNGYPIGVCLMRGKACNLFQPGNHGSTFGGSPLASRVGLTVIDIIEKNNLCKNAADMGQRLIKNLKEALSNNTHVQDIRGQGLMIGIELDKPCRDLMKIGLDQKILFNVTADKVIRLLPPLNITGEQVDQIVERLKKCIELFYQ